MEHTHTEHTRERAHTPASNIHTDASLCAFAYVSVCCICYEVAYLMLSYSHSHTLAQGQNNEPSSPLEIRASGSGGGVE